MALVGKRRELEGGCLESASKDKEVGKLALGDVVWEASQENSGDFLVGVLLETVGHGAYPGR